MKNCLGYKKKLPLKVNLKGKTIVYNLKALLEKNESLIFPQRQSWSQKSGDNFLALYCFVWQRSSFRDGTPRNTELYGVQDTFCGLLKCCTDSIQKSFGVFRNIPFLTGKCN